MTGRGRGGGPAFTGRGGGRITSLQARDAQFGGRGGRGGRGKKILNRGLNGNFMKGDRSEASAAADESNAKVRSYGNVVRAVLRPLCMEG